MGMSDHDTHWTAKAAWMREVGATDAAWSTEGVLVHLRLGAAVLPMTEEEKYASEKSSQASSPQERERIERQRRRDLVARSSGGPVPKLDVP